MKKIIIANLLMLFSISVSAQKLEVVTTSTLKGPQGVVINAIAELAKPSGIDISPKQTGSCGEAVSYFNNSKDPIGVVWSDNMYMNSEITKQNCIIEFAKAKAVAVTFAPYDVCVRKDFKLSPGSSLTLGNTKFNPMVSQLEHMNKNSMGIKFKSVVFEGSATTLTGLINRDIDVAYLATANAAKAIQAGSIVCPYSTGSTKYGQKPLSTFAGNNRVSEFTLGMMFFVKNLSPDQISKLEKSLTKEFASMMDRQEMVGSKVGITDVDLSRFIEVGKFKATLK